MSERPEVPALVRETMRTWLINEMSNISEDCWCAGWLDGTEFSLWQAIQQLPEPYKWGMGLIDVDQLKKLKEVSEYIGEWAFWDDRSMRETPIAMAEWLRMFQEWDKKGSGAE